MVAAGRPAYLVADERAARWTAVAIAALSTNVLIDAVAVKGELLGFRCDVGSLGLALEALRVLSGSALALLYAFLAGLAG